MPRLEPIELAHATQRVRELLHEVEGSMGMVPNLIGTVAHSPTVLEAFLCLRNLVRGSVLPEKLCEQIALAVAERHVSRYGVAAHAALGRAVGLSDEEIRDARLGRATSSKADAAVRFAVRVVDRHGRIGDEDWARLRAASYSPRETVEILAWIGVNTFSDYFAQATQIDIDFPELRDFEATEPRPVRAGEERTRP